jgi:hypothetical protein
MNSKTTLAQVLSLMLVSCLILFGCKGPTPTNEKATSEIKFARIFKSEVKTKREALALRTAYCGDPKHLLTSDGKVLEGFIFDAKQIREIVDDNKGDIKAPDNVVIYFGLDAATKEWHIIVYGGTTKTAGQPVSLMDYPKGGTTLMDSRNVSIYDKADPCPPCIVTP